MELFMKRLFVLVLLVMSFLLNAKPEKIISIRKTNHESSWYENQAKEWKKVIENDKSNADAWYNYMRALGYINNNDFEMFKNYDSKWGFRLAELEKAKKAIPKTWQIYSLEYALTGDRDKKSKFAKKAIKLNPNNPELMLNMVTIGERTLDRKQRLKWNVEINKTDLFSKTLLEFGYNLLSSVDENGILFVNGDNDTFPIWILQDVYGIRQDVIVLNLGLAYDPYYLKEFCKLHEIKIDNLDSIQKPVLDFDKFFAEMKKYEKERKIYFSHTCQAKFTEEIKGNLYNTGLVNLYTEDRIDNIGILKRNFEQRYRLDYLTHMWEERDLDDNSHIINNNYFGGMVLLIEHYKNSNELGKMNEWIDFAFEVMTYNRIEQEYLVNYLNKMKK
jgi:tetratricopeptide (TPR) repeat protein